MKRDALVAFLKELGWAVDKFDHLQKTIGPKKYRVKLQATSCRLEVQIEHEATEYSKASKDWVRFGGDYYSTVVEIVNGVRIGAHVFERWLK